MIDILTIKADDPNVLTLYHKQKLEFQFQQKSDNDFVMFLLDTAMRVITIVQHLAPVLEAVSASSTNETKPLSNSSDDGDSTMETDSPSLPTVTLQSYDSTPPMNVSQSNGNKTCVVAPTEAAPPTPTSNSILSPFNSTMSQNTSNLSANALQSLNNTLVAVSLQSSVPLNLLSSKNHQQLQQQQSFTPQITSSVSYSTQISSPGGVGSTTTAAAAAQLENIGDFDKTISQLSQISQLQQELDSVSKSLVSEKSSSSPGVRNLENIDNMALIEKLQENLNKVECPETVAPAVAAKEYENLSLIKSIQESIANRGSPSEDVLQIKQEEMSPISQKLFSQDSDSRQTTERLKQLMSTLSHNSNNPNNPPNTFNSTASVLNHLNSSANLGQMATSNTPVGQLSSSPLSQLTAISPRPPSVPPTLKSAQKKNPLSMLHLQGIPGSAGATIDQAAILSALYNNKERSAPGTSHITPEIKPKSSTTKTSPNSPSGRRRPFHCVHCLKNFSFKSSLDRHISVIHLGVRRYCCPICAAAFGQKKQLKHHMSTRHGDVMSQLQVIQST